MLSLLVAAGLLGANPPPIPRTHCEMPWQQALDTRPRGAGPLRPLALHCDPPGVGRGLFAPLFSPDGRWTAMVLEDELKLYETAGGAMPASYATGIGDFMAFTGVRGGPIAAWSADSRFLWAARQTRMRSGGGWALTPLQPVRVHRDGRGEDLPALSHPAGSLDGLLWAGRRGLALAQFGSRGSRYRPAHDDPAPTFAIVDAARGRILESMPLSRLWPLTGIERGGPTVFGFQHVFAVELPDGRVRVLLVAGRNWIVWTQSEAPRRVDGTVALGQDMAFDGSRLLVMRPLTPETAGQGVVVTRCHRTCPPRAPREGDWAALYDVETGAMLWRLRRTFDSTDQHAAPPAISPDGRYALIGLEPVLPGYDRDAALVSLSDGRIVQTIPGSAGYYALGFTRAGRSAWLYAQNYTALYRVD